VNGRTYSRDAFLEARALWESGEYGWQWQRIRRMAAERGYIYPPSGTRHDDREVESPTQRAIVWRALEDNPGKVEAIVQRATSWNQVVDQIIGMEARLARDAYDAERDIEWSRKDEPDGKQATLTLKAILNRIGDS
jgi:hypothetical protein